MSEKSKNIINQFLKDNSLRFSAETIRSYRISLNQFFTYCPKDYDQVVKNDVLSWMSELTTKGQKPNTVRLKLAAIKSLYHYLMEENLVATNVVEGIKPPALKEQPLKYLDKKTLAKLFELTRHNPRDRAIMELLYATGVRASELLNIRLSDIKPQSNIIWIRKGKGNKERFVLYTARCAERIKVYLEKRGFDSPYLFSKPNGTPYSRCWLNQLFRQYSEKIAYSHSITPHVLRHTFAAHLAEKGMKASYIQELLGHKKYRNTEIYTRLSSEARKKQYDRYQ